MSFLRATSHDCVRAPRRGKSPARRLVLRVEDLERRLALSTAQAPAIPDGVSSLALGDVNGDRLVDIVIGGRVSNANEVQILDGRGWPVQGALAQSTANVLDTLQGTQVPSDGTLNVAAGDFAGKGVSDVAVTSDQSKTVTVYQFQYTPDPIAPPGAPAAVGTALDAKVTPSPLGNAFSPPELANASGLTLAAADFEGSGTDQLVVGATGPGGSDVLDIMKYDSSTNTWQRSATVDLSQVGITGGVSLSAGDLLGTGKAVIAVASSTTGEVAVYQPSIHSWITTLQAPTGQPGGARVAVVANEQATGALVVTPNSGNGSPVLIPAATWVPEAFTPSPSFGTLGGALVSLGGGWVYPKITYQNPSSSFPSSNGPAAPTVLLASTRSDQVLVQGFLGVSQGAAGTTYTPNYDPQNTFLEPALALATPQTPFTPLEETGDMPAGKNGSTGVTVTQAAAVVAYPQISYHSPYSINLSNSLPGVTTGLFSSKPYKKANQTGWGPSHSINHSRLNLPTGNVASWLQQRLLTVYNQAIGVAYQHHHTPFWQPTQGSPWNVASIGYQSRGIDCTNLTSFTYADALGIWMTGATKNQAAIGVGNKANWSQFITVPSQLNGAVQVQTFSPPTVRNQATYQSFVNSLQPGDILFINSSVTTGHTKPDPSGCVHAITYLGGFGSQNDNTNPYLIGNTNPYLIVDSTGNAPPHVDSNGHLIPGGVYIRPFGAPGTVNDWYFMHVDHVLRLIVSTPVSTASPTA